MVRVISVLGQRLRDAAEAHAAKRIAAQIWAEIDVGYHNTSDGHEPDSVILNDGSWFVSYAPIVEGGIRWETQVR
jgi:hypothetical protein